MKNNVSIKHIYIVGDSNAKFLINSSDEHKYFHDIKMDNIFLHIRGFKSKTAFKVDYDFLNSLSFVDGSTVLFYFGFVDIRSYSCRYNNTETVANQYVSTIKRYFKDKNINIGFIEPIPSVDNDLWNEMHPEATDWISGSLDQRIEEHSKFVSIINQEQLFIPIIGPILESYRIDLRHSNDLNHLNPWHNKALLEHILDVVS